MHRAGFIVRDATIRSCDDGIVLSNRHSLDDHKFTTAFETTPGPTASNAGKRVRPSPGFDTRLACKRKHSDKCSSRLFLRPPPSFSLFLFSLFSRFFLHFFLLLVVSLRRRHVDARGKQALSHALEVGRRTDYACNAPYSSDTCVACRLHPTPLNKPIRQEHDHLTSFANRSCSGVCAGETTGSLTDPTENSRETRQLTFTRHDRSIR